MQGNVNEVANALKRVVEMSSKDLRSEEDVKIKVVLPILRADRSPDNPKALPIPADVYGRPASQHILRLLKKRGAFSESRGVDRKWLDEQLIGKVEGVHDDTAVSFGIMELRDRKHEVDNEDGKKSGRPIGKVWLLETHEKPTI